MSDSLLKLFNSYFEELQDIHHRDSRSLEQIKQHYFIPSIIPTIEAHSIGSAHDTLKTLFLENFPHCIFRTPWKHPIDPRLSVCVTFFTGSIGLFYSFLRGYSLLGKSFLVNHHNFGISFQNC